MRTLLAITLAQVAGCAAAHGPRGGELERRIFDDSASVALSRIVKTLPLGAGILNGVLSADRGEQHMTVHFKVDAATFRVIAETQFGGRLVAGERTEQGTLLQADELGCGALLVETLWLVYRSGPEETGELWQSGAGIVRVGRRGERRIGRVFEHGIPTGLWLGEGECSAIARLGPPDAKANGSPSNLTLRLPCGSVELELSSFREH